MSVTNEYSIAIRPSTEADIKGIQEVFSDGAFSNIIPAFKLDIQKKSFHCFTVVALGVAMMSLRTVSLFLVAVTIFCCLFLLMVFEVTGALIYVYGPHNYSADVSTCAQLREAYLTFSDTCLWVAVATSMRSGTQEIAGTIAIARKPSNSQGHEKKVAWLRRMGVKQKFRRMGIARRLVTTAITFSAAQGYDQIELVTTDIHAPAKRLYEQVGFMCASHKRHSYFRGYLKVWMYEYVYDCKAQESMNKSKAQESMNDSKAQELVNNCKAQEIINYCKAQELLNECKVQDNNDVRAMQKKSGDNINDFKGQDLVKDCKAQKNAGKICAEERTSCNSIGNGDTKLQD